MKSLDVAAGAASLVAIALAFALLHHPFAVIVSLVVVYPLLFRWATLLDYLVLGAPFMAYAAGLHVAASDAIVPLAAGAVAILLARKQRSGPAVAELCLGLVLFCICALSAVSFSVLLASDGRRHFDFDLAMTDSAKFVVVLAYCVLVGVLVAVSEVVRVFKTLRLWSRLAAALGIGSMLTQFAGVPLVPAGSARSLGFFQDPNLYAGYLLVSFAVALACEAQRPSRWTPLILAAIAGGVAATASRSGLATLVVLVGLALLSVRLRRVRLTLLAAAVPAGWIALGIFSGNSRLLVLPAFQRLVDASQDVGDDPRLSLWGRAIELWSDHPLTGIGIGQYVLYSTDVYGTSARTGTGFVTHNTFLSILTELGLIGFCVVGVGFLAVGRRIPTLAALSKDVRNAFFIGLVGIAAQMMTLNLQNIRYVWIYFGVVLGLAVALRRDRGASAEPSPRFAGGDYARARSEPATSPRHNVTYRRST